MSKWLLGLDVGSTTVKAALCAEGAPEILWRGYRRHQGRQAETALAFLQQMEAEFGLERGAARLALTGSGAAALAPWLGGRFVQEVHAVAMAVEALHPEAQSVFELGGQDAKMILLARDAASGRRRRTLTMNDKCAGGTGAVIDRIAARLGLSTAELQRLPFQGAALHAVAGKCGVFAETDMVGLQRAGASAGSLMASLYQAIVQQNLGSLTRGQTPLPGVLLLGGPHAFLPGLREAWRLHLAALWRERGVALPPDPDWKALVRAPEGAEFYAALGAIEQLRRPPEADDAYRGAAALQQALAEGRRRDQTAGGAPGLTGSPEELAGFLQLYGPRAHSRALNLRPEKQQAVLGLDAGSTSTKAVLLTLEGRLLASHYHLGAGQPVEEARTALQALRSQLEKDAQAVELVGAAVTGYARELLQKLLQADAAVVETVAHMRAAQQAMNDPQVVLDVGGQDIKLIVLREGRVCDFRLNSQCSAGNGYFLQAAAAGFGIAPEHYAAAAFQARSMPEFSAGCAVFQQADIANFQRQGWGAEEILAALAAVLPRNIFHHVAATANLPALGRRFVLQGGVQKNLAAVKAEVDFLRAGFQGTGVEPEILVHPHCGEAGALGAALEALRLHRQGRRTTFPGLQALQDVACTVTRSEATRCGLCPNRCQRTFLAVDDRRLILASCEKGMAEDPEQARQLHRQNQQQAREHPNFAELACRQAFGTVTAPALPSALSRGRWTGGRRRGARRDGLRVGIPRLLYHHACAPLLRGYLQTLGVRPENIVFSAQRCPPASRRSAVEACFPVNLALAHVEDLLRPRPGAAPLDALWMPAFESLCSDVDGALGACACPAATAAPAAVRAAFTREQDLFAKANVVFLDALLSLEDEALCADQLYRLWRPLLGQSRAENAQAVAAAFRLWRGRQQELRRLSRRTLDRLEAEQRIGLVLLAHPYHQDPQIHHGLLEQFQQRGYPIFTPETLPRDPDLLERLFGDEVRQGSMRSPMDLGDVWKNSYSAPANQKIWAAQFAARHPNLAAIELSSFRCGLDAPIAHLIEAILDTARTPLFSFRDLDENNPAAALRIRVETADYFLRQHRSVRLCAAAD